MPNITRSQAVYMIENSGGKIFTATFIKRSDGSVRTMNARKDVVSHLHGGSLAYNAKAKNLLTCFDMQSVAYRTIPVEGLKELKIGGSVYNIIGE